jgi:hypothetical protein
MVFVGRIARVQLGWFSRKNHKLLVLHGVSKFSQHRVGRGFFRPDRGFESLGNLQMSRGAATDAGVF